ncbi:rod shape-determining protein MreC [Roseburia sp. AM59-24XD]|jgi:rod shape-determining protein MreC|uniref:rod shape-determining protein MreC n=1 Tax=Roseburia sp. AM59-24XD TaxID=2293138 RepID=UPI000E4871B9|nr:rod shape-determining protein MreC [Roseburia sp. AM59-24XD]RHP87276.1 rod shape-determining protein MreC [Roseburia sp. AM59-24XD]
MRKRTKITMDPKYILMTIAIVSVALIIVSFRFQDKMTPIRTAVGSVVTPMQRGINKIGLVVADGMDYATTVKKLVKKNNALQKQLDDLSQQNRLLQQDKYDLDDFRKLYSLDEKYSNYPKVAAHVISSDGNWFNSFVIDKGSKDGLKVNMNVLAGDGLVGIVTEVNKSYARVRSIIDDESSVTGSFLKTSDMCFVNGNLKLIGKGMIDISGIPADAEVKDGYEVVTSPVSDKYLPGILIGYARDIKTDSSNITQSAHLTPAADFSGLDMVLVITEVKDSGDLEDILN